MNNLPKEIHIKEEGPREGFQFEKGPIPTARKIELIDALSRTGVKHMQIVSFVNPKAVPGMADAEEVVRGIKPQPGVAYTGLWFNDLGLERAIGTGRLEIKGSINLSASDKFLQRNLNRTPQQQVAVTRGMIDTYRQKGIEVERATIMAAFGCNFEGDVPAARVVGLVGQLVDLAARRRAYGSGGCRSPIRWPGRRRFRSSARSARCGTDSRICDLELHLHDTRGMGIANAYAGLEMGVERLRFIGGRAGRLSICVPCRRGGQRLHRGSGVHVR